MLAASVKPIKRARRNTVRIALACAPNLDDLARDHLGQRVAPIDQSQRVQSGFIGLDQDADILRSVCAFL